MDSTVPSASMANPYELTGRARQKARTRAGMVAATRELLAEGITPTVEQAAERAAISRTTAYRYFPNRRALLLASHPALEAPSLLERDSPPTAAARLDLVSEQIARQTIEHEPELRAMLRLSLDTPRPHPDALPLRQGRAIAWIDDALAPLRGRISKGDLRLLVLAIRATLGIEALVWLTDIGGLSREQAGDLMRASARTLLRAALVDAGITEDSNSASPPSK
jgi:AcrR family transcriptional regulator